MLQSAKDIIENMQSDPRYSLMHEYKRIISNCNHVYNCSIGTPFENSALYMLEISQAAFDHFSWDPDAYVIELEDPNSGYVSPLSDFLARIAQGEF
jgi:hypothetical protein